MSKPASLSEAAYDALQAAKVTHGESLSDVILRYVPRPIHTFGDLEKHLESRDGPVIDMTSLGRVRERKRKANHAH